MVVGIGGSTSSLEQSAASKSSPNNQAPDTESPGEGLARVAISRRAFIQTAATGAAGLAALSIPGIVQAEPIQDRKTLRRGRSELSAVWANCGGDKVTQDELRGTQAKSKPRNHAWSGSQVTVSGARNEVVAFNLVLEAGKQDVADIKVTLDSLKRVGGSGKITSRAAKGDDLFDYRGRNIELFTVGYLPVRGLSTIAYETYDERHVPERMRRPHDETGHGRGNWEDRPDHDKSYPDIAVPIEAESSFSIRKGENQSIWVDVYIPKGTRPGTYKGEVQIVEKGKLTKTVPVKLTVRKFTLPDEPASKTMLYIGYSGINQRYLGVKYPNSSRDIAQAELVRNRHFQMAHRHGISLIDDDQGSMVKKLDRPSKAWETRLNGKLFTAGHGYAGPGVGVGNSVYAIRPYGKWEWKEEGEAGMQRHAKKWVAWFKKHAPGARFFLYLIDESDRFADMNRWAKWLNSAKGAAKELMSFATLPLPEAAEHTPELDIVASTIDVGAVSAWEKAAAVFRNAKDKLVYFYNGHRPATGTFMLEDDGVALRQVAWAQWKKGVDRWFYWEGAYYDNYQGGQGETNVFQNAHTFGGAPNQHNELGQSGGNDGNGDGVLFYPGTDQVFPKESRDLKGPIASLRLKLWRRGIQDAAYLEMAHKINPKRVEAIVERMVPKVLWENGVDDPSDPTWKRTDISWSVDPDDWEQARQELAKIIEKK
ncbi:DUF4091 domain-containing protein [Oligoflexia bacterium]|nr:DUF4091 domain-containing protein [Oligoflexia bacterium]